MAAVCAAAAQLGRDYLRDTALDGQQAAARSNRGGRPKVVGRDKLPCVRALREAGTPMPKLACEVAINPGENPPMFTVRTMGAYTGAGPDLVWYGPAGNRAKASISAFGILDGYQGVLVRDDCGGYVNYDEKLTGVQQCVAHLLTYLGDAHEIDPSPRHWPARSATYCEKRSQPVNAARTSRRTSLGINPLGGLHTQCDEAVTVGVPTNRSRPWPWKGEHPGAQAREPPRAQGPRGLAVHRPVRRHPTDNGSESAARGYKLAVKISRCSRFHAPLQCHRRFHFCLTISRNRGV